MPVESGEAMHMIARNAFARELRCPRGFSRTSEVCMKFPNRNRRPVCLGKAHLDRNSGTKGKGTAMKSYAVGYVDLARVLMGSAMPGRYIDTGGSQA